VSTSGKINAFKAKEQSGLDIQSFKADFLRKNNSFLKFIPKNSQTLIKTNSYRLPSIAAISDTVEELSINTTLKKVA
jgi:hypothetical protein